MSNTPYDEPRIKADDLIIRRINPIHHVIWDDNRQVRRLSSKAYSKSSGHTEGLSVDIEALIAQAGMDARVFVTTPDFIGSVYFNAQSIRALNLWVGYDPVPDQNPYHGQVWHPQQRTKFTESQKSGLAEAANWFVPIPGVEIR